MSGKSYTQPINREIVCPYLTRSISDSLSSAYSVHLTGPGFG